MRACLIAPGPVGASRVSHSVRDLAGLLATRHEVTVVYSGWDDGPPRCAGAGFREIWAEPAPELYRVGFSCEDHRHSAAAMDAIRAAYGEEAPDYLEVCDFRAHGLVPLQARLSGDPLLRRTMVGVRVAPSLELQALHDGTMGLPGLERVAELEREQLRLADRLIVPGGDVLAEYTRHYRDAELPLAVTIRPAVELPEGPPPARADHGGPLRLLYVGGLRRSAGALDLADACRWLPGEDWRLTMAGADTETAAMGQSVRLTIEAMGGGERRVRCLGPVAGRELRRLRDEHDLLVVPSRLDAWSPEALAATRAGLPVLATPVGGLAEIVAEGVSGWHTAGVGAEEIRRSLSRLLADRGELCRLGPAGVARAAELCDPGAVLGAYEELLGPRVRRPLRPRPRPDAEPLVTGVVPYYEASEHVGEAVSSLLGQTHRNLEVLIVNDGSFREEDGVLAELALDPRVRVLTQPNRGDTTARNLGARLADGEYLAMLDADNRFEPEFVERALGAFRRDPSLAYVTCWLRTVDVDGSALAGGYAPLGNGVLRDHDQNWDGDTLALLPTRLFTEEGIEYDPVGAAHPDWQLYRRLRGEGRYGAVIPERLARYRIRPDSLSRAFSAAALDRGWGESRDRLRLLSAERTGTVSELDERAPEVAERRRIEELERVNEALAAELRILAREGADAPGSAAMPTSRRLARIIGERDDSRAELARVGSELQRVEMELEATAANRDEIERVNARLAAEVGALRGGVGGLLRRARARLLRSRRP